MSERLEKLEQQVKANHDITATQMGYFVVFLKGKHDE
jgi:hypothetical protein